VSGRFDRKDHKQKGRLSMIKIDLSGKQALVTGSTSGIGYAITKRLAEGSASVVVHGRTEEHVSNACPQLSEDVPGIELHGHVADLADTVAVKRLIETFPHIDIHVRKTQEHALTIFVLRTEAKTSGRRARAKTCSLEWVELGCQLKSSWLGADLRFWSDARKALMAVLPSDLQLQRIENHSWESPLPV
jgi:short chain dehydrogenase